jgi:site-specific DNA recombinase
VIGLVTQALRESHHDEKRFHEAVVAKLQAEHKRIQNRIDTIYLDRLDGRIDADFFDRNAAAFRDDQTQILSEIHDHQTANQSYIEEGIKLLDLAGQAHELFENQPAGEKRNFWISYSRTARGRRAP